MRSVVQSILEHAMVRPNAEALRFRQLGIWETTTWAQYAEAIRAAAGGLRSLGVDHGVKVGLMGENSPSWLIAFFATQMAGGVAVVLDPNCSIADVATSLHQHKPLLVVAGDQEQFDRIEEARSEADLSSIRQVAVIATRGLRYLDAPSRNRTEAVLSWQQVPQAGSADLSGALDDGALAVITPEASFTSAELNAAAANAAKQFSLSAADETMALGLFSQPTSFAHDVLGSAVSGMTLSMSPVPELMLREIAEIRPTTLAAPTAVLGLLHAHATNRAEKTRGLKKFAYRAALKRGGRRSAKPPTWYSPLLIVGTLVAIGCLFLALAPSSNKAIARLLPPMLVAAVFAAVAVAGGFAAARAVRNQYGLGRVRSLVPHEVPPPAVGEWFNAIGVPVGQPGTGSAS